jgi:DNA repair exonuclease SbcCD ATPase subunit
MSTNDIIIKNELPAEIVALQHTTLDEAMSLCERAHAIVIPSASIDEHGCRSALAEANRLYDAINGLAKQLEEARMERGREISSLKSRVDAMVKAATDPLNDQRAKLGSKLLHADRELKRIIEDRRRAAEAERLRIEAEQRAAAQAAERARQEAEAAAARAEEAARKAADVAAMTGHDPLPDDAVALDAARAAEAAAAAVATAAQAQSTAIERTFEAKPAPYVAPAPRSSVKVRTEYSLQIDNLSAVPMEASGVTLWKLDEPTVLRLLRAGVKIPGLTLVETETTSSKGRSSAFAV